MQQSLVRFKDEKYGTNCCHGKTFEMNARGWWLYHLFLPFLLRNSLCVRPKSKLTLPNVSRGTDRNADPTRLHLRLRAPNVYDDVTRNAQGHLSAWHSASTGTVLKDVCQRVRSYTKLAQCHTSGAATWRHAVSYASTHGGSRQGVILVLRVVTPCCLLFEPFLIIKWKFETWSNKPMNLITASLIFRSPQDSR